MEAAPVPEFADPAAAYPLARMPPFRGAVSLIELTGLGALCLRGSGAPFLKAVGRSLGVSLPVRPNRTTSRNGLLALWLGPDEWTLRMPIERVTACTAALLEVLAKQHAAVVDVSDQSAFVRLSGANSRNVLASGCPLDLHSRAIRPGHCARSLYLKVGILIHQVDAVPTYDIQVQRSQAEYLWHGLVEAASEAQSEQA